MRLQRQVFFRVCELLSIPEIPHSDRHDSFPVPPTTAGGRGHVFCGQTDSVEVLASIGGVQIYHQSMVRLDFIPLWSAKVWDSCVTLVSSL